MKSPDYRKVDKRKTQDSSETALVRGVFQKECNPAESFTVSVLFLHLEDALAPEVGGCFLNGNAVFCDEELILSLVQLEAHGLAELQVGILPIQEVVRLYATIVTGITLGHSVSFAAQDTVTGPGEEDLLKGVLLDDHQFPLDGIVVDVGGVLRVAYDLCLGEIPAAISRGNLISSQ